MAIKRPSLPVNHVLCEAKASAASPLLGSVNADFNRQMKVSQDVVARYRNALRELAK